MGGGTHARICGLRPHAVLSVRVPILSLVSANLSPSLPCVSVMELAALYAGKPKTHGYRTVHPVLAVGTAARRVEDFFPLDQEQRLHPLAARLAHTQMALDSDAHVLSVRLACWTARQVLDLAEDRAFAESVLVAAEAWCDDGAGSAATFRRLEAADRNRTGLEWDERAAFPSPLRAALVDGAVPDAEHVGDGDHGEVAAQRQHSALLEAETGQQRHDVLAMIGVTVGSHPGRRSPYGSTETAVTRPSWNQSMLALTERAGRSRARQPRGCVHTPRQRGP